MDYIAHKKQAYKSRSWRKQKQSKKHSILIILPKKIRTYIVYGGTIMGGSATDRFDHKWGKQLQTLLYQCLENLSF